MNRPESSPPLPRGPLVLNFRDQIAARHEAGKKADADLKAAFLLKLNLARETGSLLEHAKNTLRESEFREATDFLDREAVRTYLKFARHHEEPITDLQTGLRSAVIAMQSTGLLPMPSGHGEQNSHDPPPFFSWASHAIMQFKIAWAKYLHAKPLDAWSIHEAEQFAYSLRQILKIHKQVTDWMQRR